MPAGCGGNNREHSLQCPGILFGVVEIKKNKKKTGADVMSDDQLHK